ncbi:MAG TPA: aminodeoxychorismate/anthranilate synthase component II [Terriglobales bacterium]|nr:aminodeoxychorismate/anthranilate synthase component II [Terriglobales bacterium]
MRVLIIDNFDSFVYNLAQYVGELRAKPMVHRNNAITIEEVVKLNPDRIIISPGPGRPDDPKFFGVCLNILKQISPNVPTLGVCLGHQGIAYAYGASIIPARRLMHGKTSLIKHEEDGLFAGVENPLEATRYHSLACRRRGFPNCLEETATSLDDNEIMGLRHREYPIYGVQFHPESILTSEGMKIMKNFLKAE